MTAAIRNSHSNEPSRRLVGRADTAGNLDTRESRDSSRVLSRTHDLTAKMLKSGVILPDVLEHWVNEGALLLDRKSTGGMSLLEDIAFSDYGSDEQKLYAIETLLKIGANPRIIMANPMVAAMNISFIDFVRASVKEAAADGDYDHNLLRLLENHDDKGDVVEARAEEIDTDKLARRVTLVDSLSMMSYSASGPVPRIPTPIQALRHEVNEVDGIGLTPLFAAFLKGGGDALFTGLLEAGADPMQALIFQDGQNRQHSLVSLLAELNQNSPSVEIKARAAKALQMIRNHSRNCSRAADSSYLAVQHANVAGLAPIPDYMLDLSSEFFSGGMPIGIDPVNNDIVLDDGSRLRQVEAEVPHPHE